MSKPGLSERDDREEDDASEDRIDGEVLPADTELPEDAVVVDLTDDAETQDWIAEGRRSGRRKRLSEASEEEAESRAAAAREKIRKLNEEQSDANE